jgi:hypothetical protein
MLFCNHAVGMLCLARVLQQRLDWSVAYVDSFMLQPIKSLQSLPMALSYVFHSSRDTAKLGKSLAKDMPGYNAQVCPDDEDVERQAHAEADTEQVSLDICVLADKEVVALKKLSQGIGSLILLLTYTQPASA